MIISFPINKHLLNTYLQRQYSFVITHILWGFIAFIRILYMYTDELVTEVEYPLENLLTLGYGSCFSSLCLSFPVFSLSLSLSLFLSLVLSLSPTSIACSRSPSLLISALFKPIRKWKIQFSLWLVFVSLCGTRSWWPKMYCDSELVRATNFL